MWFDPVALSKPLTCPPATLATSATSCAPLPDEQAADSRKSQESQKSQAPHDLESAIAAPWDSSDWQCYFNERAGVAEFDGGLSRHEAEHQSRKQMVETVQAEALDPATLGSIVRQAIVGCMDKQALDAVMGEEDQERQRLAGHLGSFGASWEGGAQP